MRRPLIRPASLVLLGLAMAAAPTALAQQAPVSLRGRVVAAENEAALPRARVVVTVNGREVASAFTDDRGRFTLTAPGPSFIVAAFKAGYAGERFIASSAARSSASDQIDFALSRAAAIVGRVADSSGGPAVETRVVAERLDVVSGTQRSAPFRFQADTDDLGEYRIGGLAPGRYTVSPLALASRADAASTVALRPGDEAGSVNFIVPSSPQGRVAPATPPAEGNGVIRVRVRGPSGRPLANVAVTLLRVGASTRRGSTDEQGRFAFTGLRAGPYRLEASKTGYVTLEYGPRALDAGRAIDLRDDEAESIDLALSRGAAVTGTVVDEHGEPLEDIAVRVLQLRYASGRTLAMRASLVDRRTDDRGRYRLFGLMPGSYLVTASADDGIADGNQPVRGFAPVYYPGTTRVAEASHVKVDVGRDAAGIDLVFTETPVARISGIALDSSGSPLTGTVSLASSQRGAIASQPQLTMIAPDGRFTLPNVPPGDYVIHVVGVTGPTTTPTGTVRVGREPEFGTQAVSVTGGDPEPLSIRTSPGSVLIGRLSVEGPSDRGLMDLRVTAYADEVDFGPLFGGGASGVGLSSDGRFRITGLHGPTRFRLVGAPAGWYLKSVVVDGAEVTDVPFDFGFTSETHADAQIVLSSTGAAITGHVTNASAAPVTDYAVIVFGTDRGTWFPNSDRVRLATPRQDGSFEVSGLPPGEYWVAAVDRIDGSNVAGDWQKPEALEQLSFRAQRKTLVEGERFMTILRLIRR